MVTRRIGWIALGGAVAAAVVAMIMERDEGEVTPKRQAPAEYTIPDTLRAVTLYGPTSYFMYREQPMGLDYEMLTRFAADNGMVLDLKVATSIPEMLNMVRSGQADLVAYDVPRIAEYRKGLRFCGKHSVSHQVLVQPASDRLTDVTDLIGKTVYVEKGSKYQFRLSNLNDELGGGIGIEAVVSDTLETTDLIKMVNDGDLPLTVTDSDMADIVSDVYPKLDLSLAVGMDQYSSWVVAEGNSPLSTLLDKWAEKADVADELKEMHKKYFEHIVAEAAADDADILPESSPTPSDIPSARGGVISRYDHLFRHYASQIGWDWRQLAAIGYTESKFNPTIVSWAGARGLMQIMPSTAKAYGIAGRTEDPEASVMAASKILRDLDKSLQKSVGDPAERRKFVIAAYNSGLGHIQDAIALANKYGRNPGVWYGNVREMALLKTKPQYYNDPVVKHGYFRGQETVNFVDRVMAAYERYRASAPE